ncbi:unnamed protein product, partial [Ascophyllum nodosum]
GRDLGRTDGDDSEPMSEEGDSEDEDDLKGGSRSFTVTGVVPGAAPGSAAPSKQQKNMPPIEVELQMQLLWKNEYKTLHLVFSSGKGLVYGEEDANGLESAIQGASGEFGSGYRLFFLRDLAVPPPRFRPPMDMGGVVAEHPQNVHLTKILGLNEKLRNAESL